MCDEVIRQGHGSPIIDNHSGKASSADQFPFHNWYNFVLGYTPEFPDYMLQTEGVTPTDLVGDPFMGSGTTLVCAKMRGIPCIGLDANDFMLDAATIKLRWDVDPKELSVRRTQVLEKVRRATERFAWGDQPEAGAPVQAPLFASDAARREDYRAYVQRRRPDMLSRRYISDKPLAKAYLISEAIQASVADGPMRDVLDLALTSVLVPISNVRYGPGFGVVRPRGDADVVELFGAKVARMVDDLAGAGRRAVSTPSLVTLGDARQLGQYWQPGSVSLMITSPPYPGDHEYTKHTRLELIFRGYATDLGEFRVIKKRMLRGSTTNVYSADGEGALVSGLDSIRRVTDLIARRLEDDGATSGFEKLYTKVVWEYFGGMHRALEECFKVLKPGGRIALLVSDSHAFKMVHIETAKILQEIGEAIGFVDAKSLLWQLKVSTSHRYSLRENILILSKPLY